ncbi:malic enzyme, putative [Bodo saltans]|uniref:Malic enzyme, putative n=1 Tax=Bodo saltans TaxID=75058 RepID=A0A0S4J425_BODSA|nr:malic enzyme, putative [Bodo saltans]|eukprot:CUG78626.1 malic enzyme, putative [Bodo saltans]
MCAAKTTEVGTSILTNRYDNKGTAFTAEERQALAIRGRLPPRVETLDEQVARCLDQLRSFDKPINKYQFLATLHTANTTLYYALILASVEDSLPIIYTPTVGEACQKFGNIFFRERGMYIHSQYKGMIHELLEESCYKDVDVIVITDGSRILGLGDLGANGMGISIGKCSLYVVGGGVHPKRILPVCLDAGTNNESLRNSLHYLGTRTERLPEEEFYGILDEFMDAVKRVWPGAVVQFEDFSNNHCFDMLTRYQEKYRCFNDDIQGTGAVVSAGFLNAVRVTGKPVTDHKIVVFGAGSAAVGVALAIADLAVRLSDGKITKEEVIKTFYLVDTKGLVTNTRGDKLAAHKIALARTDIAAEDNAKFTTLEDVVKNIKPTALLGLGGVGPVFTEDIIRFVSSYCERPIIFPLSNPSSKSEVIPSDAYLWSNGKAIIASGSPFAGIEVNGTFCKPSQGNNMYIFPGIGMGCALAKPTYIPDSVIVTASARLYDLLTPEMLAAGALYPSITEIREISSHIATAVIMESQRLGLTTVELPKEYDALLAVVKESMWQAEYPNKQ